MEINISKRKHFIIQMKNDFRKMEDEMNKLDSTLMSVTQFSDKVNTALHEKRSHISQLSGVHTLLHKVTSVAIHRND